MNTFEIKYTSENTDNLKWKTVQLPTVDNGYYDTLAAIGFGALADSYYKTPKTPIIEWTPNGFQIHYVEENREIPDLKWLKYSLAASWKSKLDEGTTKVTKGWDGKSVINHEGAVVDTSLKPMVQVIIDGKQKEILNTDRRLFGVINKLGKPDWVNLCIKACRERGLDLINNEFEEKSITLNSIVFPQSSKGANSKNSFSIGNGSMPKSFTTSLSRLTCFAVAGLCFSAIGESPSGFAIPIPQNMRTGVIRDIAKENRNRYYYSGFFFPFNNYLNFVKVLLLNAPDIESRLGQTQKLKGVAGVSFVELGTSASPSATWQLMVPSHKYTFESVEKLQNLLVHWRREKRPKSGGDPSIDRKAVRTLMNGFESSNPVAAAEGYLKYLDTVGIQDNYNLLNQTFFEEIMEQTKYQKLLEEFRTEEIQHFITLIRDETYKKVFTPKGKKSEQPNYQMMRKLKEIQNSEDFINALTEIAVERGTNKLASKMTEKYDMRYMVMPHEDSLTKLIELSEIYPPKMIAQLLLAFALSKKNSNEEPENEITTITK